MLKTSKNDYEISILGYGGPSSDGSKGLAEAVGGRVRSKYKVNAEYLSANVRQFCQNWMHILDGMDFGSSEYELDDFEVSVEVSAEGEVSLIGSVSAGMSGGITLTFKRKKEK